MDKTKGTLTVIAGCMSSGKSTEMLRLARRAEIAKRRVQVYAPDMDLRSKGHVASRDGHARVAILARSALDIWDAECAAPHDVVGIDEAQFFDVRLAETVTQMVDRLGIDVLVAGLDTDFRGQPFGMMPTLLALADTVFKLDAICVRCGARATRSQRLIGGRPAPYAADIIQVGGDESYEARCRSCHDVPR